MKAGSIFMRRTMLLFMLLGLLSLGLAACSDAGDGSAAANAPSNAIAIDIIYAPESEQYMPEIMRRFNESYQQGIHPVTGEALADGEKPVYISGAAPPGSLSSGGMMQGIVNAALGANVDLKVQPTLFAPSVSHWLSLANLEARQPLFDINNIQPTANSPVVIAIWESRLEAIKATTGKDTVSWQDLLGVLNAENGWQNYGIEGGRRSVYYGHADPRNSSTSLSTLIMEFYACARENGFEGRRLELEQVYDEAVQDCVRGIEQLVRHYAARTEDFLPYIAQGPNYLDFVATEETDVICLNTGGRQGDEICNKPSERLVAIYPEDGTFWHEHPIAVVNADWVSVEQAEAGEVFIDFMLMEAQQELIMSYGFRPSNPDVEIAYPFVEENGVSPEGPTRVIDAPEEEVLTALRDSWSLVRKQADIILLFDVSGSMMTDGKMEQAKQAANAFLDNIEPNNRVALYTFSDGVTEVIPLEKMETVDARIRGFINGLRPDGGTEMYMAVRDVVTLMSENAEGSDRIRAVVLLSDGGDTGENGVTLNDALRAISNSKESKSPVVFVPVAYGSDADTQTLNSLARTAATQVIFGDPANIDEVLQVISAYF